MRDCYGRRVDLRRRADVNGTDVRGYQRLGRDERRRSLLSNGRNSIGANENDIRSRRTPGSGLAKQERSRHNVIAPDDPTATHRILPGRWRSLIRAERRSTSGIPPPSSLHSDGLVIKVRNRSAASRRQISKWEENSDFKLGPISITEIPATFPALGSLQA